MFVRVTFGSTPSKRGEGSKIGQREKLSCDAGSILANPMRSSRPRIAIWIVSSCAKMTRLVYFCFNHSLNVGYAGKGHDPT